MDTQNFDLNKILFEGLNQHGFLFQERCADILKANQANTHWHVLTEEYPVTTDIKDTRIDFILGDSNTFTKPVKLYSIVECKRVNLEHTYGWLFGCPLESNFGTPFLISLRGNKLTPFPGKTIPITSIRYSQIKPSFSLYVDLIDNWWLEIGRNNRATPQPIEDALLQVCMGVSGFLQEQEEQYSKGIQLETLNTNVIPIIITNAPLYYASYDLKNVDLTSGSINSDSIFLDLLDLMEKHPNQ